MPPSERNNNSVPSLQVKSNVADSADVILWGDPSTHRLLVDAGSLSFSAPTADNSAFTAGSTTGMVSMGFYHSTIDTVTDGRAAALAIDSKRNLFVVIRDAAGNARGLNIDSNNNLGAVLASETTKVIGTVRVLGNGGAIVDAVVTAATAPANGLMVLGIYNSTEPSPTTGQSVGIQLDSKGRQRMVIMDAAANTRGANVDANNNLGVVLAAETTKVLGTVRNLGNVGAVMDAVITATTAPANGLAVLGVYNSTELSPTNGQSTAIQIDSKGRLKMTLRDAAGNDRGANVDSSFRLSVTVDNIAAGLNIATIGTSITPGTSAAHLGKAEDAVAGSGDTGVFALGVANEAQSSLAADGDYIAMATDTKGNRIVVGNIAHDGVDAGAPIKIGAKAVSSEPAVVAAADRANLISDLVGKLIVLPYANPENFVSGVISSAMTGTTSTSLIAAPASGLRNYITHIICSNGHATVGTDILIQDGSGGTTLYVIPAAAVYGGSSITLPTPLRQPTTATAIFVANVTTGASTKVSASGYKGV